MMRSSWNFDSRKASTIKSKLKIFDVKSSKINVLMKLLNLQLYTRQIRLFGDLSDEDIPGSIPNPAVKLVSADGTWGVAPWESKSSPISLFYFLGSAVR